MKKQPFGKAEIDAWGNAFDKGKPPSPTDIEWPNFPQVDSFRGAALSVGVGMRLQAKSGERIEFLLNPVSARALAAWILTVGQEAGWLDDKGNVIAPPPVNYDS